MISGSFSVQATDDPRFVVGQSYAINIDDTTITLAEVTTTTITATGNVIVAAPATGDVTSDSTTGDVPDTVGGADTTDPGSVV